MTKDNVLSSYSEPLRGVEGFSLRYASPWYIFFGAARRGTQTALSPPSELYFCWTAETSILEAPSFEIFDYLDRSFTQLEHDFVSVPPENEFVLKQAVVDRLRRILYRACDSRTVFPQLAPDSDGGLVAVWHAGELMIQINTDDELHSEVILIRGPEIKTLHVSGEAQEHDPHWQESIGELRSWLLELGQYVNKHNPRWRRLFQGY